MAHPEAEPELRPAKHVPGLAVRVVGLAIAALAILWLGYGIGRVQDIAQVSSLSRDASADRYSFSRGGTLLQYERLGGDGKPYVRSADGFELLDLSDWDHNSRVVVDGSAYDLVRLFPSSAVDYGRYRIVEGLTGDGWLLQREVSLDADGSVHVTHSFVARRPLRHVDLAVSYVHAFLSNLHVAPREVSAGVTRQTREQSAAGADAPIAYSVRLSADPGSPGPVYRAGDSSPLGPTSVIADMSGGDFPIDQRVILGKETIRIAASH